MAILEFSPEAVGKQSNINAEAVWLATISYFVQKGDGLDEWLRYVGDIYAQEWNELVGITAKEAAYLAVLNWVSCGAKQVSFEGDGDTAEAVVEFPTEEQTIDLKIDFADAHKANQVFVPIAKKIGLNFAWESKGNQVKITFSK